MGWPGCTQNWCPFLKPAEQVYWERICGKARNDLPYIEPAVALPDLLAMRRLAIKAEC